MQKLLRIFYLVLFLVCSSGYSYSDTQISDFLRNINEVSFCGKKVPLDRFDVRERLEKEILLCMWDKAQVFLWLKRSKRYFPVIDSLLEKNQVHNDLRYIAVIESALRANAKSSKRAVGFWQFIPSTGIDYGLKVNKFTDERRDINKSTMAAINYLKDLYERFGSWELSLAAYNMGESRLKKFMEKQNAKRYYDLWLPQETMRYFFRIIAAKLIFENYVELGFDLRENEFYPELKYSKVNLKVLGTIPLKILSSSMGISFYEFKVFNPHFLSFNLRKGNYLVYLPKEIDVSLFRKRFSYNEKKWLKDNKVFFYTVKRGDSLMRISRLFNVKVKDILRWNNLDYKDLIYPGQKLKIMR